MKDIQRRLSQIALVVTLLFLFGDLKSQAGEDISVQHRQFFETHVRPLLVEHCYQCHSEKTSKANLRVDSRGHLLLGGDSGAAIVPGKPEESLLIEAVRYESYEMPPSGKLKDEQIAILTKWIEIGAPWPGDDGSIAQRSSEGPFSEEDRQWWAFQPVSDPDPPTELNDPGWCLNPIDQFISAQRDQHGLKPAPEADRATLIRRLYFDLIGLPPTPEEVQRFEADPDPKAYEHLVDDLLNRPEYGERWARHWLDLVRYAESDGYRADIFRPQAWRYRDYVIQSLNEDKPYDRFVQEQLAGDELFPDDPAAQVATGFLRHGIFEYNVPDVRGQWDQILNEVTDVTGDVFFGIGFQCARCHNHKFDPLLQEDYFRLRAFFEPMLPRDDRIAATPEERKRYLEQEAVYLKKSQAIREELDQALQPSIQTVFKNTVKRYPDDIKEIIDKPDAERTPREKQYMQFIMRLVNYEKKHRVDGTLKGETKEKVLALRRELAKLDSIKPAPLPMPMTISDVGPVAPPTIIPKKNVEVSPGFPKILEPEVPVITPPAGRTNTTGRRSALARWLTSPENPLSTRVIVNRVWQYHFGRGLAANASDLGRLGGPPSHPQLLDWLTSRFIENGWRLKNLHRLIVTSATYRQSAAHPQLAEYQLIDPTNRWYWRGDIRRLDAEQIRDAIFAVTGQLQTTRGGPSVLSDRPRRSIYTRVMRNSRDPLLESFDLPFFMSSTSMRDTTTSPIQSLLLINSQTMIKHAETLARRVTSLVPSSSDSTQERIEQLWWLTLGRAPTEREIHRSLQFLIEQERQRSEDRANAGKPITMPTGKVPYRDGQAVLFQDEKGQEQLKVPSDEKLNVSDFTLESHLQLRSIYSTGDVRTIAGKISSTNPRSGWLFGVTGKRSRRKPQTLVLQIFGKQGNGPVQEVVLFSDHDLELNKPYYVAVSVKLAKADQPGSATFYLKDLGNEEEPLERVVVPLSLTSIAANDAPLSIGARGDYAWRFHGLIDDLRISSAALSEEKLLVSAEGIAASTIGYWKFEPKPGLLENSIPDGLPIQPENQSRIGTPREGAFVDLCHVLLNSSEFLYVD